MRHSIDDYLSFEIKKELADRYFGFRKLIEDDIREYDTRIVVSSLKLEQKVGYDLIRLYILLKDKNLIHDFLELAGLREKLFFDPYLAESATLRQRVFAKQQVSGLTKAGRFNNLVIHNYQSLEKHLGEYRTNFEKLTKDWETISEEIKLFYQKNDLSHIMSFLRGLDGGSSFKSGGLEGAVTPQNSTSMENKMRVASPPPVEDFLPDIPQIVPLGEIRKPFKKIIDKAFRLHSGLDWKEIVSQ